jgi:Right handed beta helix region
MTTRYFANNAAPNAHALAIQGNDSWNGLFPTFQGGSNGPKRNPDQFDMNNLQAGDEVLFAEGSYWDNGFNAFIEAPATSSMARTNMIRFGSYDPGTGATGKPWFNTSYMGFLLNGFSGTGPPVRGGYLIEDIKFTGPGFAGDCFAICINPPLKWVWVRRCEISNFKVGIAVRQEPNCTSSYVLVQDTEIHHCGLAGLEGSSNWLTVDNCNLHHNGEQHPLTHAIYAGSSQVENTAVTFRHNHLHDNNLNEDGACVGGNLTVRGKLRGTHLDDNRVLNEGGKFTMNAYGIAHRPGYDTEEYHLFTKARRNQTSGMQTHVSVSSVPGIVLQGNEMHDNGTVADSAPAAIGIGWPSESLAAEDVTQDSGAQVLDNSFVSDNPRSGTQPIWANGGTENSAGAGVVIRGNNIELGPGAGTSYGMTLETLNVTYADLSNNTLVGGDGWTSAQTSTAALEAFIQGQGGTSSGNVRS